MLVHYLNVPYPDDNKLVIASSVTLFGDKKEWTKEELISQLKPMCKLVNLMDTSLGRAPCEQAQSAHLSYFRLFP